MKLDQPVPDFTLADQIGRIHLLSDYRGRLVVINFSSAECPHAERVDRLLQEYLGGWGLEVELLTILSNDNETPEQARAMIRRRGLPVVLRDEAHRVADRFEATTTPHLFVLDREGRLRYRGAFDDVAHRQKVPTRLYLKEAVDSLLAGRSPDPSETAPCGCSIIRFVLE